MAWRTLYTHYQTLATASGFLLAGNSVLFFGEMVGNLLRDSNYPIIFLLTSSSANLRQGGSSTVAFLWCGYLAAHWESRERDGS